MKKLAAMLSINIAELCLKKKGCSHSEEEFLRISIALKIYTVIQFFESIYLVVF